MLTMIKIYAYYAVKFSKTTPKNFKQGHACLVRRSFISLCRVWTDLCIISFKFFFISEN